MRVAILGIFSDSKIGPSGLLEVFFFICFIFIFTTIEKRFVMLNKRCCIHLFVTVIFNYYVLFEFFFMFLI
jgi:hypothetical protein